MVFFQLRYILLKILGGVTGCFREPQGSIWVLESSMGAQVEMAPVFACQNCTPIPITQWAECRKACGKERDKNTSNRYALLCI